LAREVYGVSKGPVDSIERRLLLGRHPDDPPRRILVCGGRDYSDRQRIRSVLSEYLPAPGIDEPTVVHGAARGADRLAKEEAQDLGFWVEDFEANWGKHGKAAGPIRNRAMLDTKPDLVIAFPGGKGTADCVAEARRRGITVREVL
jgi:hypothetical protein